MTCQDDRSQRVRPGWRPVLAGSVGSLLATAAVGVAVPLVASADLCSATADRATCYPARYPIAQVQEPGDPYGTAYANGNSRATGSSTSTDAFAQQGNGRAAVASGDRDSPDLGGDSDEPLTSEAVADPVNDPGPDGRGGPVGVNDAGSRDNGDSTSATAVDVGDRRSSAHSSSQGPRAATGASAALNSRADSVSDGTQASSAAAAIADSTARSEARGSDAFSAAAAADHSRADSSAHGDRAASGAAAYDHSTAFSRALGDDATARSSARDHDYSLALAGPHSSADVAGPDNPGDASPAHADCSGFLAAGLNLRSGNACLAPIYQTSPPTPAPHYDKNMHEHSGNEDRGRKHHDCHGHRHE